MSIEEKLKGFVSTMGPCPPIPKRGLLHLDPEAYLCEALAALDWELRKSHEIADYLSPLGTSCTILERVPESLTPQLRPSVQEIGT